MLQRLPVPQPETESADDRRDQLDTAEIDSSEFLSTSDEDGDDAFGPIDGQSTASWFDRDIGSFLVSFGVHLIAILILAVAPVVMQPEQLRVVLESEPIADSEPEFDINTEITHSDVPQEQVGSNSVGDVTAMALSMAPELSDVSEIPAPETMEPQKNANVDMSLQVKEAVGLVQSKQVVRGMTGVAMSGTQGAVDRITEEILKSIEERPTTVVWLFDSSVSLQVRLQEIRDRFDHIYEELGIVQSAVREKRGRGNTEPLLTSIVSFGKQVDLMTKHPTSDILEIRKAIDAIKIDASGEEYIFTAIYLAADKYKDVRIPRGRSGPERNLMLIAVTDERGSDTQALERTVGLCNKYAIPVYILGSPAPFGREHTYMKYVDPDPNFDQTPQWGEIDQGPESIIPERVYIGSEQEIFDEPIIDSGFGPYALSRLCYETGGIFFTIHPNRRINANVSQSEIAPFSAHLARFFDPDKMFRYRPDYVSEAEYLKMVRASPIRQAVLQASQLGRVDAINRGSQRFVKTDEVAFANQLTEPQQEAARMEPRLYELCTILFNAEKHRGKEVNSRWLAAYDLACGEALAAKVRTESYNLMLAAARRGMPFKDPKNNTWVLNPSNDITVGSKYAKEAEAAKQILQRVANDHAGTPWAYVAERELRRPIGWSWKEAFTDLTPPPPPSNDPPPPPPPPPPGVDDQARMITPPPRREIPKL